NDRPPQLPAPRRTSPLVPGGWIALALLLVIAAVYFLADPTREIKYSEFNELVDSGQVKEVVLVGTDRATGKVRDPNSDQAKTLRLNGGKSSVLRPLGDDQTKLIREWEAKDQQYRENLKKQNQPEPEKLSVSKRDEPTWLGPFLLNMLLLGFVIAVIVFFFLPPIRDPMDGGFLYSSLCNPATH